MLTQHGPVVLIPQLRYSDQITNVVGARTGAGANAAPHAAALHAALHAAVLVVVKSDSTFISYKSIMMNCKKYR
jgi:hypothetical protein